MMVHVTVQNPTLRRLQDCRGLAALAACLMLGACGQLPDLGSPEMMSVSQPAPNPQAEVSNQPASNLQNATDYWGKQYAKNPRDLKNALSFARNLKAMGQKRRAISVLQQAAVFHGHNKELAGEYGRLALEFDQLNVAKRLLAAADNHAKPDWKVIAASTPLKAANLDSSCRWRSMVPAMVRTAAGPIPYSFNAAVAASIKRG